MADLILGAAALGVAVPGIVVAFAQCGEYFVKHLSKFKDAPELIQEMAKYGVEMYDGRMKDNLALMEWAFDQETTSASLKDDLEDQFERLKQSLIQADKVLRKSFDSKGGIRRTYFVVTGERKLRRALNDLERWHNDFWASMTRTEMQRRVLPDPLFLSENIFKTYSGLQHRNYFQNDQDDRMWVTKGQLFQQSVREVTVLIEKKDPSKTDVSGVREIVSCLTNQANSSLSSRGILNCLGYRNEPEAELVFEIPTDLTEMQTLENLVTADQELAGARARPLDYRFRLARGIAEAVLSVHALKRVHKNIRTSNILLLKPKDSDIMQMGNPFLIDWAMLRSTDMPSSMAGEQNWLKDIYRHPRRQGLQPEQRYNMGHDIYSLGVCLLEIGLWEPLVAEREGHYMLSSRYLQPLHET